jgi:hypothetical protein
MYWDRYELARNKQTAGSQYEALVDLHNFYLENKAEIPILVKWHLLAHEKVAGVSPRKLIDQERLYGGTRYPY